MSPSSESRSFEDYLNQRLRGEGEVSLPRLARR